MFYLLTLVYAFKCAAKCECEREWAKKNGNFWRCVIDCKIAFFFISALHFHRALELWFSLSPLPASIWRYSLRCCCVFCIVSLRQRHVLPSEWGTWNWICWFKCVMSKYSQWHSARGECVWADFPMVKYVIERLCLWFWSSHIRHRLLVRFAISKDK